MVALASPASWGEPAAINQASTPFQQGVWTNQNFFPIAVWLQSPANAESYRKAGINTYVGLWRGPTPEQVATLAKSGMQIVCSQNNAARSLSNSVNIIAWMHGDEPDNAQSLGEGKGWGPPVLPEKIVADYRRIKAADPSRPVLLNLGQGVAWDNWHGRGTRSRHPEDYPKYIEGSDVVSFDIYPAVHDHPEVAGKLWFVAHGVERLRQWSGGQKIVWNCIEASRISNPNRKPTPEEIRAEVWMSLIHGSRGLIYFVHQFKPTFKEASLLEDPVLLDAVTAINQQIHALAPILNSASANHLVTVQTDDSEVPVATMVKQQAGRTYIFAVGMRAKPCLATFSLKQLAGTGKIQVLGEDRDIVHAKGTFTDRFTPWGVHLYVAQ